jgi:hypothetical protein
VTTLGNGSPPPAARSARRRQPQARRFSLVNSQGSVPVTGLTVTTTGYQAIQSAAIFDEAGGTQYFSPSPRPPRTPSSSAGHRHPVGTTVSNYKVVITYRGEAQSPPVGDTPTTAAVSAIVTANTTAGSDTPTPP